LNTKKSKSKVDLTWIDEDIIKSIIKQLAFIKEIDSKNIHTNSNLILDLYFDSLDLAEIKLYILNSYKNAKNTPILKLKIVWDLVLMSVEK
jgi:hypothetical protein